MSRITESLTALLIAVNARYKAHAGIRLTGPPDAAVGVSERDVVVLAGGTGGAKLARGHGGRDRPRAPRGDRQHGR